MYKIDLDYPTYLFKIDSILYTKNNFDYRNLRNIIYYGGFDKDYKSQHDFIKVHGMYRIDRLSYLKIKKNNYSVLALIY